MRTAVAKQHCERERYPPTEFAGEPKKPQKKRANYRSLSYGWVSYLHRAATTNYLCCGQALEDSPGAGRIGLTHIRFIKNQNNKQDGLVYLPNNICFVQQCKDTHFFLFNKILQQYFTGDIAPFIFFDSKLGDILFFCYI